jgi:hypothetical protein
MAKKQPKNAGKAPSVQFYFKDYYADMLEHPDWVNGLWILLLCKIWHERNAGEITRTYPQFAKMLGVEELKVVDFFKYLALQNIADVTQSNANVTVVNRRAARDHKARNKSNLRVRKFREKQKCNANETPKKHHASTSTSTSVTTTINSSSIKQQQVTPENDPDLNPVERYSKSPAVESFNERRAVFVGIAKEWNTFAKKKTNHDDVHTESAVLQTCFGVGGCGLDQFNQALDNYKTAVLHPHSQAWPFNLHKFAVSGHKKFLPGVFDIDNYDKTKFDKAPENNDEKIKKAMDYK